jgi:hypothetical protein
MALRRRLFILHANRGLDLYLNRCPLCSRFPTGAGTHFGIPSEERGTPEVRVDGMVLRWESSPVRTIPPGCA